ncbi:MAG: PspC domain-containing protein [Candidatus Shapirobacteria bacterium]|nr:PspC domain-containing protein [Candidatus Shapirobacteria bacterium]
METKKLFRSIDDNIIAGVCGGLAKYFQIDSSLIRIIFILLAIGGGSGFLIYLILWLVIPIEKETEREVNKDKAKSMAKEIKFETKIKRTKRINILGVVLILVGLVSLWNQIFPKMIDWDIFWPIVLVLIGMLLIFRD